MTGQEPMMRVDGLEAGYGEVTVLWGVDMEIERGAVTAILGPNGAGKTTLMRCISGLSRPKKGRITFDGADVTTLSPHHRVKLGIVLVPEGRRLFPDMTVHENLLMGAHSSAEARAKMYENLEMVYNLFPVLKARRRQLAGTMSGGEQQMLAIARGLMARPKLLLLDEPSAGLAPKIVLQIFDLVKLLNKEYGITIALTEQHVENALRMADAAYVMENGRVTLSGSGKELLSNPKVKESYLGL
jgi:branched-chain amino acid transport system ATP-binding protein